jgi:hypothetical protein
MSQLQSAPTWRQRSASTDLEACVSENMSAHDHKVTDKCFGSLLMFQLFAYNKISRQPAFHGGDTTAPIFLRLIREETLWGIGRWMRRTSWREWRVVRLFLDRLTSFDDWHKAKATVGAGSSKINCSRQVFASNAFILLHRQKRA